MPLAEKEGKTGLAPSRTLLSENFILKIRNTEISLGFLEQRMEAMFIKSLAEIKIDKSIS